MSKQAHGDRSTHSPINAPETNIVVCLIILAFNYVQCINYSSIQYQKSCVDCSPLIWYFIHVYHLVIIYYLIEMNTMHYSGTVPIHEMAWQITDSSVILFVVFFILFKPPFMSKKQINIPHKYRKLPQLL